MILPPEVIYAIPAIVAIGGAILILTWEQKRDLKTARESLDAERETAFGRMTKDEYFARLDAAIQEGFRQGHADELAARRATRPRSGNVSHIVPLRSRNEDDVA